MDAKYLWFTVNTITNYEQKVARDLKAIRNNRNINEIREIIVPMEEYTTKTGIVKEKPRVPNYFYVRLEVNSSTNQPPTWVWHLIRNIGGCIGILKRDDYMIGMEDFEIKEELGITDEDIARISENL